jgi:hypothetical protein
MAMHRAYGTGSRVWVIHDRITTPVRAAERFQKEAGNSMVASGKGAASMRQKNLTGANLAS